MLVTVMLSTTKSLAEIKCFWRFVELRRFHELRTTGERTLSAITWQLLSFQLLKIMFITINQS